MFAFRSKQKAGRHAECATRSDLCQIFERDAQPLYLLAFLLTANHASAEQCFVAGLEDAVKENAVFKEWAHSWSRWIVIRNAIRIVFATTVQNDEKRDMWLNARSDTQASAAMDAVARLAPLERFVFVMSLLEGYSDRKCCLFLSCTLESLMRARIQALRKLPSFDPALTKAAPQLPSPQALPATREGMSAESLAA